MGKRKSSKPPPKKVQQKLPTSFACPFCNHEGSIECRLDKVNMVGEAVCKICAEKYVCPIDTLSDPIDVYVKTSQYSEWIDECERANQ
eukprot:SM000024S07772  [mRNA]  locus=s24:312940:313684:- [translate_table: standard]